MQMIAYVRLALKWSWLFVLAALIAGGAGYKVSSDPIVTFSAETLVSIGRYVENPNPDSGAIQLGRSLAATYEQIVRTEAVIGSTIEVLDYPLTVDSVRGMLNTELIEETSILTIRITNRDPEQAVDLSRTLAEQLIIASPTNLTRQESLQIELAVTEVESLSEQLNDARSQVENIDEQLLEVTDEYVILRLTNQRNTLTEQINQASANLAQFNSTIVNLQQRTNELSIVDTTRLSRQSDGMSRKKGAILAAFVGLVLAGFGAVLIEYFNFTIRSPEEATALLKRPLLGSVKRFGKSRDPIQKKLVMDTLPFSTTLEEHHIVNKADSVEPTRTSTALEGYRTIRTNLLYGQRHERCGRIVILSPNRKEGRTLTIANLAAAISFDDLRVLLIDGDLRNPAIHEVFGLPNDNGLTTLIDYSPRDYQDYLSLPKEVKACIQETKMPNLSVITAGPSTSFPTELVSSERMIQWIEAFNTYYGFDYILLDTPPALAEVDGSALAAAVRAKAILLVDINHTTRNAVTKVKEHLDYLGVETMGIIANRAR